MSLIAAGGLGGQTAAAASFHGGRLAVAGDPSSPHLAADRVTATVYVAGAKDDGSFTAEQAELLESTLTTPKRTPGTGKLSASSTGLTSNAPEAHATPAAAIFGAVGGAADVAGSGRWLIGGAAAWLRAPSGQPLLSAWPGRIHFAGEDLIAQPDTLGADVNAGPGNQPQVRSARRDRQDGHQ